MRRTRSIQALGGAVAAAVAVTLAFAGQVSAAPGDPITTFGTAGLLTRSVEGVTVGMVVQADGKIVTVHNTKSDHIVVSRLTTQGKLDPTFSGDGQLEMAPFHDAMHAVAIALDGTKIVVLSQDREFSSTDRIEVDRFLENGSLDSTFGGGDGRVTFVGTMPGREAQALAVMGDHRIVVVANDPEGASTPVVHRLTAAGVADTTFGGDGEAVVPFGNKAGSATSIAVGPTGGIVVAAQRGTASQILSVVARMTASGAPKSGFGTSGYVVLDNGGAKATHLWDVEFTSTGRIVAAGYTLPDIGKTSRFVAVRLTGSGALDTTFSGDGYKTVTFSTDNAYAYAFTQQADGKLLIVGGLDAPLRWGIVRLTVNGNLDSSFSTDGRSTVTLGATASGSPGVPAISPNGKRLYVAGTVQTATYHPVIAAVVIS